MANSTFVARPKVGGGVQSAPLGTVLPTDADTDLATEGFVALGLVGEDGISKTEDRNVETVYAFGGERARDIQTQFGLSYDFELLETNAVTLTEVFGEENVDVDTTTTPGEELVSIKINGAELPRKVYVFEVIDGYRKRRVVLPNAQITAVEQSPYTHSDVVRYAVTVTAYKDDAGYEGYEYLAGPTTV